MVILSADTSTNAYTVGLFEVESPPLGPIVTRTLSEKTSSKPRRHVEELLQSVDDLLGETGLSGPGIDALAISIGPGSFTGLRIGASMWKGLALGWGTPLVAVPTLDAMTRLVDDCPGYICPLIDARMDEVYGAVYQLENGGRRKRTDDLVCALGPFLDTAIETAEEDDEKASITFVGDGAALYRESIQDRVPGAVFPTPLPTMARASCIAEEAAARMDQGLPINAAEVAPVYLRRSQAERVAPKLPTSAPKARANSAEKQ